MFRRKAPENRDKQSCKCCRKQISLNASRFGQIETFALTSQNKRRVRLQHRRGWRVHCRHRADAIPRHFWHKPIPAAHLYSSISSRNHKRKSAKFQSYTSSRLSVHAEIAKFRGAHPLALATPTNLQLARRRQLCEYERALTIIIHCHHYPS